MSRKPAQFPSNLLINLMILGAVLPFSAGSAFAAGFTISTASTSAQTLSGAGIITSTGSLTLSGSTVPITVTGNSTITNSGQIIQTGTGRGILLNSGTFSLGITNSVGALIRTADADTLRITPTTTGGATLDNYGGIISLNPSGNGNQAVDWSNITSGSNVVTNYSTGLIQASEADSVRPGVNGFVYNAGTIKSTTTTGSSSDGIDAQSNSGITIVNAFSGSASGLIEGGRHGITGGNTSGAGTYAITITNNFGGTIQGDNGSGINIDGINGNEVVTIINAGTITGNGHNISDGKSHDGDGVDVDGLVNLTNSGTIKSINAYGGPAVNGVQPIEYSEGVTVGGGTIVNTGLIQGSVASGNTTAIGRGITIAGVDKDANGNAIPIQAPYAATTITNSGTILGDSDSAITFSSGLASGFSHTINNQVGGLIQTGSTMAPAILTAADNVTINNAGVIDGSSSGNAITGGSGNLTLVITGSQASIIGNISGGVGGTNTMRLDLGTSNSFSYSSGTITNFASVEIDSGTMILSGANRIAAGSVLNLNGGVLEIANAGGANGQSFASLILGGSSKIDLDSTSLTFNGLGMVGDGLSLDIIDYLASTSPDYAFRFQGNFTANADFLKLIGETQINGVAAGYSFDGTYTNVTLAAAPIPEADAYALMALGMGLVGFLARRKRA